MKKRVFGRHLNRDTNERKALFKSLMTELVLHERITTTEAKARAIRGQVEKLVTKAKRKGQQAEYLLQPYVSAEAVKKLLSDLAPRYVDRPGGYTRIIKTGNRFYDNASVAIIEFVDRREKDTKIVTAKTDVSEENLLEPTEIQEAEIVTEKPKATMDKKKKTVKKPAVEKQKSSKNKKAK